MHSDLISIFGIQIQAYGVCLAVGFLMCYWLAHRLARASGRDENQVDFLIMMAGVGGIIGARLVYVIQFWEKEFAHSPAKAFHFWSGGLVFYGGFLLAATLILIYAWLRRRTESSLRLLDFCAVFVPLGHAFGRVGCFFHGCCFGGTCSTENVLAVTFPRYSPAWSKHYTEGLISRYAGESMPVWPTQLMEAAGLFVLFALFWWLYRGEKLRNGMIAGLYLCAYAVLRYGIEILRDDPRGALYFGVGLTFSQVISVGVFVAGLFFVFLSCCNGEKDGSVKC